MTAVSHLGGGCHDWADSIVTGRGVGFADCLLRSVCAGRTKSTGVPVTAVKYSDDLKSFIATASLSRGPISSQVATTSTTLSVRCFYTSAGKPVEAKSEIDGAKLRP